MSLDSIIRYLRHDNGCNVYRITIEGYPSGGLFALYPTCDCGLKEALCELLPEGETPAPANLNEYRRVLIPLGVSSFVFREEH